MPLRLRARPAPAGLTVDATLTCLKTGSGRPVCAFAVGACATSCRTGVWPTPRPPSPGWHCRWLPGRSRNPAARRPRRDADARDRGAHRACPGSPRPAAILWWAAAGTARCNCIPLSPASADRAYSPDAAIEPGPLNAKYEQIEHIMSAVPRPSAGLLRRNRSPPWARCRRTKTRMIRLRVLFLLANRDSRVSSFAAMQLDCRFHGGKWSVQGDHRPPSRRSTSTRRRARLTHIHFVPRALDCRLSNLSRRRSPNVL